MREIDINIEGYNVNGICVGCLNYNRKMFYHNDTKECFMKLAEIDIPDGLSVQLCWECVAFVRRAKQFREQILKSYDILSSYSKKHTFLNCPSDFTQHATTRLSVCEVDMSTDNVCQPKLEDEVIEVENDEKPVVKVEIALSEYDDLKTEDEIAQMLHQYDDFPPEDQLDLSSEDDMHLSELKLKKEKIKKVKRRTKRLEKSRIDEKPMLDAQKKLRKLPPELVSVYEMTEEEMWAIRQEDQENKYFNRLRNKCLSCLIVFNSDKHETEHAAGKHQPKGEDCLQCNVCKGYFLTKDHLTAHRNMHLIAYRCIQCDFKTSTKAIIRNHIKVHDVHDDTKEYHCTVCDKYFDSKSKLTYHRGKHHKEKLQCDCCGKVFATKMTLKYHLNVNPTKKEDKSQDKINIPCKGCNKVFNSKKSYRAHAVIHTGITYPCQVCGKLFQWKRNLARHMRNHRDRDAGAVHECRECGKTFSSRDCYNNHMKFSKRHVMEEAYVHECNYCGKKFATKWCMIDHVDWEHLKVIKYQCSVCFKPFKTAKIMVAHMNNIHEGKKSKEPDGEHLCEVCGKSYKTVKRLKGHVWAMHTNRASSKSFKCKLCPATFAWQTSIYKHMKMMHENKRSKQSRLQSVKKQDAYVEIEPATRMQYFQPNNLNIVLATPTGGPLV